MVGAAFCDKVMDLSARDGAVATWVRDVGGPSLLDPAICDIIDPMNRAEAITQLQTHAASVQAMGATSLYLFGSTVRDEAQAGSDLDLFLDYDPTRKFSLIDLVGIKLFLEERLGTRVDLTTRDSLHPRLRDTIERSAIRVF